MPRVYLGIGSNIDPQTHVRTALHELAARYAPLARSAVYRSPAVGFSGDAFLNLVVGFDTDEPVEVLAATLHTIESRHGRVRGVARFGPRSLDLDLLLYGDLIRRDPPRLPRPEILEYAFVLRPLAEIAPRLRHPERGLSYAQLWRTLGCGDSTLERVELWSPD